MGSDRIQFSFLPAGINGVISNQRHKENLGIDGNVLCCNLVVASPPSHVSKFIRLNEHLSRVLTCVHTAVLETSTQRPTSSPTAQNSHAHVQFLLKCRYRRVREGSCFPFLSRFILKALGIEHRASCTRQEP